MILHKHLGQRQFQLGVFWEGLETENGRIRLGRRRILNVLERLPDHRCLWERIHYSVWGDPVASVKLLMTIPHDDGWTDFARKGRV